MVRMVRKVPQVLKGRWVPQVRKVRPALVALAIAWCGRTMRRRPILLTARSGMIQRRRSCSSTTMTDRRVSGLKVGEVPVVRSDRKVPLDQLVLQAQQVIKDLQDRKVTLDRQALRAQMVLTALMELQVLKVRQDRLVPKARKESKARRATKAT
jgi:hypothetical protein